MNHHVTKEQFVNKHKNYVNTCNVHTISAGFILSNTILDIFTSQAHSQTSQVLHPIS